MLDIDQIEFDESYKKAFCSSWVATAIVGGSVIGGLSTAYSANKAASAQTAAANKAQDTALGMYNTTRGDLQPFRQIGQDASNQLTSRLGELTSPIVMDQAALEKTPGYQFNLSQGLKSVQNSAAARGLGNSGAALKGAANFATGLADNTYKTQFDIANTNQSNAYNRLKALIDTGENAGAQTGALGEKAANTVANAQIGVGNVNAAKYNAIGGAVSGLGNNIAGYGMYRGLYGGNNNSNVSGGGTGPGGPGPGGGGGD